MTQASSLSMSTRINLTFVGKEHRVEFAEYHLKEKGEKRGREEAVQDKLIFLDNLKTPAKPTL